MKSSWIASRILERTAVDPVGCSPMQRVVRKSALALRGAFLLLRRDTPCRVRVAGLTMPLMLPLSHQMPAYRARHPYYDRLIRDLADHIRVNEPLRMIDVGANVGDSILAAEPAMQDAFLAFEPHPAFIPYVRANTQGIPDVTLSESACGSGEGAVQIREAARGTAGTTVGEATDQQATLTSLDAAIPLLWPGLTPNFVKIDTDGFDVDVMEGGPCLWREARPWLFYEMDPRLTRGGVERHLEGLAFLSGAGYVSAAAFTNLGDFDARLSLADTASWRALMQVHSVEGAVQYHDLLLAPSEQELTRFLAVLTARRGLVAEASAAG